MDWLYDETVHRQKIDITAKLW